MEDSVRVANKGVRNGERREQTGRKVMGGHEEHIAGEYHGP